MNYFHNNMNYFCLVMRKDMENIWIFMNATISSLTSRLVSLSFLDACLYVCRAVNISGVVRHFSGIILLKQNSILLEI